MLSERLRGKAQELERQAAAAQVLEAELQRARRERRQRDGECAALRTELLQIRDELKDTRTGTRDIGDLPEALCQRCS